MERTDVLLAVSVVSMLAVGYLGVKLDMPTLVAVSDAVYFSTAACLLIRASALMYRGIRLALRRRSHRVIQE